MIDSFWHSIGQQVQSWFSQAKAIEVDGDLVELPDTIQTQLMQRVQALSSPKAYQTVIQNAISTAIQTWQQDLDAPNSLVFLGSPVEPMAKILNDSLEGWQNCPVRVITPLPYLSRPSDPLTIAQQIQQAFQPHAQIDPANSKDADEPLTQEDLEKRTTLMVVPCLEQCFLRCIGGWEGVEYLRDIAIHHRNCFWVIGCSHWTWDFLDFICQISAYFSQIEALPELDGAMLRDWLEPLVQSVVQPKIELLELQSGEGNRNSPSSDESRRAYWDSLASQASGIGSIAANLWIKSLRIEKGARANENSPLPKLDLSDAAPAEKCLTLHEIQPSLPSLPSLTSSDRYLLHSLLIHGQMTRAHLAFSLGQQGGQIQSQIQWLLRAGLLSRSNGGLSVQSIHYKKLKAELANNNFFVGKD